MVWKYLVVFSNSKPDLISFSKEKDLFNRIQLIACNFDSLFQEGIFEL